MMARKKKVKSISQRGPYGYSGHMQESMAKTARAEARMAEERAASVDPDNDDSPEGKRKRALSKGRQTRRDKLGKPLTDAQIAAVMKKRKPSAVAVDLQTTAKTTFNRNDRRTNLWAKHPGRYDIENVDTKPKPKLTREQQIEKDRRMMIEANKHRTGRLAPVGAEPRKMSIGSQRAFILRTLEARYPYLSSYGDMNDLLDNIDPNVGIDENLASIESMIADNARRQRIGVYQRSLPKKPRSKKPAKGNRNKKPRTKGKKKTRSRKK